MDLITTVGGKTSNSYVTVTEADAYLAASLYKYLDVWDGFSADEKSIYLFLACLAMDQFPWIRYPVYENQALAWPREWDWDEDSVITIPETIKMAQSYMAFDVIYRGLVNSTSPGTGPAGDAVQRLALFGKIEITMAKTQVPLSDGTTLAALMASEHSMIDILIRPYLTDCEIFSGDQSQRPTQLEEVA